jgi:O-antigen ligase
LSLLAARSPQPAWRVAAAMAGAAAVIGAVFATSLVAASPKYGVLTMVGVLSLLVAVVSGRPREFLLFVSIALIPVDIKTYQDFHLHVGGAPGFVITIQMAFLIPLVAIAIAERAANPDQERLALPAGAVVIPLVPIVAALPSLAATTDIGLSLYEIASLFSAYLLYLYFALAARPSDVVLVASALMVGILLEAPVVALQLAFKGFTWSILGKESTSYSEAFGNVTAIRVAGTLVHPNVLGGYLSLLVPIPILFAIGHHVPGKLRFLAWLAAGTGLAILLLTFNRGSWVGVIIALPIGFVLMAIRGHLTNAQATGLILALFLSVGVVILAPPVWDRIFQSDPHNVSFRFDITYVALSMWSAHQWIGVGLNTFAENAVAFDYRGIANRVPVPPVHNVYLLWLDETGVVGALGLLIFLAWAAVRTYLATMISNRLGSLLVIGFFTGFIAVYVGELASFITRLDAVQQAFFVMLGMTMGLVRFSNPSRRPGAAPE